mgnify:CR=1 FL=1
MWFDILKIKGGGEYLTDNLKDRGLTWREYRSLPIQQQFDLRRPRNYNRIKNITVLLERKNIAINRENILEELMSAPTNDDNEAIEYVLNAITTSKSKEGIERGEGYPW